jgi:transcriptional regulator with XRE-family HTH domain
MVNSKILAYLVANNISQTKLASDTGIAQQNLSRLLKAKDIKLSQLSLITKALSLPITYFFDGNENISSKEILAYQEKINRLEKLLKIREKSEIEKYFATVKEILDYEFLDVSADIKKQVFKDFVDHLGELDEMVKGLSFAVSEQTKEMIRRSVSEKIGETIARQRLTNIKKIRADKS